MEFVVTHSPIGLIDDLGSITRITSNLSQCIYVTGCWLALPAHTFTSAVQVLSLWGVLSWGGFVVATVPWMVPWMVESLL